MQEAKINLNPYFQLVEWRKMLKRSALFEVYGVEVEQPIKPFVKPIPPPHSTRVERE